MPVDNTKHVFHLPPLLLLPLLPLLCLHRRQG
jgi:hypothetical protein